MAAPAVQQIDALVARVTGALSFLPPLLTRGFLFYAFYATGSGKLEHPEGILALMKNIGIPLPELNAAFISRLEYYGAFLLLVGLLTRPAAALLSCTMVVALATADKTSFLDALAFRGDGTISDVAPLVLLVPLVWLVVFGPGLVSIDAAIARALGLPRRPTTAD